MATKLTSPALGTAIALSPHVQAGGSTASETRFLAVDGGQIAYDDTGGNGPLILAIPGMGDLRSEYRLLRPELQGARNRVVTMDVRGFGETSARWDDYSAHAVGRDALALIEHLKAGSAVILGNSFAAGSALWAAHDAPARVFDGQTEGLTRDDILDNITLYWLTNTAVSTARSYWDYSATAKKGFFDVKGATIPVAVSAFPDEIYTAPSSWAEKAYPKLIYYNKPAKGGHFAAWEQPQFYSEDVRTGFRSLRKSN